MFIRIINVRRNIVKELWKTYGVEEILVFSGIVRVIINIKVIKLNNSIVKFYLIIYKNLVCKII